MRYLPAGLVLSVVAVIAAPVMMQAGARAAPVPLAGAVLQQQAAPVPQTQRAPASAPRGQRASAPAAAPAQRPARSSGGWAVRDGDIPVLQPETFMATALAAERYAAIVAAGGWPEAPRRLRIGDSGPAVAILRARLAIEGDLPQSQMESLAWDEDLTAAVRRYQGRVGLPQTGVVGERTLKALNVTAEQRLRQLTSSAQRVAALDFPFGPRYVVVNIPSAAVEAVENGRVARRFVAVVGDIRTRSPELVTRITQINLNPTWTAPASIVRRQILPRVRRDPAYLRRGGFRVFDAAGSQVDPASVDWSSPRAAGYTLRQDPGRSNALGSLRINMPNNRSVFMHDTPSARYFGRDYRFLSAGCVRVKDVRDLASWLLAETPGRWSQAAISRQIARGGSRTVQLAAPVPVAWIYMTGWASSDGVVHFRDDVYNVDRIDARIGVAGR